MTEPLAQVYCSCGRMVLDVGGIVLAMEGDKCRQMLPEEIYGPIPSHELETATVGGEPIKNMNPEMVQWFRGGAWTPKAMEWAAEQINAKSRVS